MRIVLLQGLLCGLFLLSSCKKYQPADPAFFIKAAKINVLTTAGQGSGSHKITDLWLYTNGKFQGVYPVGQLMPVVSNDKPVRINVFAGIKRDGISDTRIFWPFYSLLTIDTLVESGKTLERDFTFRYLPATTFTWTENFDSQTGFSIQRSASSDTTFKIADLHDAFEGRSIEFGLAGTHLQAQVESSGNGFVLPAGSENVFLELNYKCTEQFEVGLLGEAGERKPAIYLNAHQDWNKIYIQLGPIVNSEPVSKKYKVYFRLLKLDGNANPKVFLDNIKLVFLT